MADSIQIEFIIAVAEAPSYSMAASRLNTSELEVRSKIAALESALCIRLFEQDQELLSLTKEGTLLLAGFGKLRRSTNSQR